MARGAMAEGIVALRDGIVVVLSDLVALRDGTPPGPDLWAALGAAGMPGRDDVVPAGLLDGISAPGRSMAAWTGKEPRHRGDGGLLASRDEALRVGIPFADAATAYLQAAMASADGDGSAPMDVPSPRP